MVNHVEIISIHFYLEGMLSDENVICIGHRMIMQCQKGLILVQKTKSADQVCIKVIGCRIQDQMDKMSVNQN